MISVAIADEHGSIIYGLDYFDQMTPAERSSLNSQMWNARLTDWLSSEAEMYEKFGIPVIRVKNPAAEFAAQQSQSGGNWGDMFKVLSTVVNSSLASVAIKPNLSAPAIAQVGPAQNSVCPPAHTDMAECAGWSVTDVALNGLSGIDALSAGIASNLTIGWSNTLRAELYGEAATRNHQGYLYNVGYWIGAGMGVGMGLGAAGYLPGAGWVVSAAARYTTVATVYAFGQSSVNLATGRFHWTDTFGFLPAIGWGVGKMLRSPNVAPNSIIDSNKFNYIFGKVTSSKHNTPRSLQNAAQMNRIGIHNTAEGQKYLTQHLQRVAQDPSNVTRTFQKTLPNGNTIPLEIRESLLSGPGGFLKLESTWEILADGTRRLTTIIPFGG